MILWKLVVVLCLASCCLSHKTHSSSGGVEQQSGGHTNEFYSQSETIVEEYPFQDRPHISPASSEKDKWITSGNLAYYTLLQATKAVYQPVTVRLIFVGFEADGNQGINLDVRNLENWFEHIEHSFHHTWVEMEKGVDSKDSNINSQNPFGGTARVEYTINVEVAKVCPLVTTIIEDAILQYIRPEDPDYYSTTATTTLDEQDQNPDFYVDAFSFSHVLGSLLTHLGIENDAYTLFILNPKRPFVRGESLYGYRAGFSTKEIRQVHQNETIRSLLDSIGKIKAPAAGKATYTSSTTSRGAAASNGKRRTIQFSDFTQESEVWARAWLDSAAGGLMVNPACNVDDESQECVSAAYESDVIEKIPILELASKMTTHGTPWQHRYIRSIFNEGGFEQCLVDGWVSNERFAFLDLTAGPFEWGPIIGGEGVRAKGSIPNVPFRPEWRDSTVPQEEEDDEIPSLASDMERYRSELALLEAYRSAYCPLYVDGEEQPTKSEACLDVESQIYTMQETIAALESQGTAEYKPTYLSGGEYEGVNATHVDDDFMSQLGATISRTVRTLFVPPTAALLPSSLLENTGDTHEYSKRVSFHVFVISNHEQYDPRAEQNFNYEEFKNELRKFSLPEQEFTFTIKSIQMSSDPVLAAAFGASLHSTVVPGITVDGGARGTIKEGTFEAAPQLYIDTNSLQQQLMNIAGSDKGKEDSGKHVPIFLFSLGGNLPVFVDKIYQSVALSNMVVAVQSNFKEWESQIACNSRPVYINLRNPLRSILASTMQYVSGLVPDHITYSEAYNTGTQNWLWTGMSNSPLSLLSSAGGPAATTFHFSRIHTDIANRNFVVHKILKAQHLLNKGVEILYAQRTTEHNLPILKHLHSTLALTNLTHYHTATHNSWHSVAAAVAVFDWPTALRHADASLNSASAFLERASELADLTELTECLTITPTENAVASKWKLPAWALPASLVGDVLLILLWFVFIRNRKAKLKVN